MDNKNNEAVDGVVASEEISLEEQQAVLEKFDQESNTRNVTGFAKGFKEMVKGMLLYFGTVHHQKISMEDIYLKYQEGTI